jgi:hypothetical protein
VVGFSESLRREVYKDQIRVTVIEPGVVATDLGDHIENPAMKAGLKERLAATAPLQAADVAAAVVYAVNPTAARQRERDPLAADEPRRGLGRQRRRRPRLCVRIVRRRSELCRREFVNVDAVRIGYIENAEGVAGGICHGAPVG